MRWVCVSRHDSIVNRPVAEGETTEVGCDVVMYGLYCMVYRSNFCYSYFVSLAVRELGKWSLRWYLLIEFFHKIYSIIYLTSSYTDMAHSWLMNVIEFRVSKCSSEAMEWEPSLFFRRQNFFSHESVLRDF